MASTSTMVVKLNCIMVTCVALLLMGTAPLVAKAHKGKLTCCDVKPALDACGCFAKNGGDKVPDECCFEAENLKNIVTVSTVDRQAACHCIQDAARKVPDINATAFSIIPERCGISLPFQFTITMNCDEYVPLTIFYVNICT